MNYNRAKNNNPNYLGQKFGRLTVVAFGERKTNNGASCVTWDCKCDCGNMAYGKLPKNVKSGEVRSCGCLKAEQNSRNLADKRRTHGKSNTRLYGIWEHMRSRCNLPTEPAYPKYGGRGIRVCEEWEDFQKFYEWAMANGYTDGLTIERVDVNGNYEPSNCTWIPLGKQAWNKRETIRVEVDGEIVPLKEACRRLGLPYKAVHLRITRYGMSLEEAFSKPFK